MTAEEFLKEKYTVLYNKHPNNFKDKISLKSYLQSHIFGRINGVEQNNVEMMAEFAEYHVEQALKEVVESINIYDYAENKDYSKFLDKNSILNAYPLTNIK
jgi:viroplasmin and RNaseH domain-containing protein